MGATCNFTCESKVARQGFVNMKKILQIEKGLPFQIAGLTWGIVIRRS